MDQLDVLAEAQAKFRAVAGNPDFAEMYRARQFEQLSDGDRALIARWHKEYALALMMESAELMDWSPWKHWSKQLGNKSPILPFSAAHRNEVKAELADLICFILNDCALWGITPSELVAATLAKTMVNHQRQATGTY